MSKTLKKITTCLLAGVLTASLSLTSAYASSSETPAVSPKPETEEMTIDEKITLDEKSQLAEEYARTKNKTRGYGKLNTVTIKPVAQEYGNWCGPAAAYCATNGKGSQSLFAEMLKTTKDGTNFKSQWKTVLDSFLPGNNYTLMNASNYSNWRSQLKNSIIYTIDKGYPVIADCHITSDSDTWLCAGYKYASSTWHYVTVGGYDDLDSTNPAEVYIGDSNTHQGVLRKYWTELDKLKEATDDMGIIW